MLAIFAIAFALFLLSITGCAVAILLHTAPASTSHPLRSRAPSRNARQRARRRAAAIAFAPAGVRTYRGHNIPLCG